MATKSYLFRDKLKEPCFLSQLDVARIRKIAQEATDQEFQEYLSCSKDGALRILGFWEVAQVELWDAEILKRFFHGWIYEDRNLVAARIQAAQKAGRLTEHFTPEVGLQWLESENVLTGVIPQWVRANARRRAPQAPAQVPTLQDDVEDQRTKDGDTRLARFYEIGGKVKIKHGEPTFQGIKPLNQELTGSYRGDAKTIRADLKAAYERAKRKEKGAQVFKSLGSRTPT